MVVTLVVFGAQFPFRLTVWTDASFIVTAEWFHRRFKLEIRTATTSIGLKQMNWVPASIDQIERIQIHVAEDRTVDATNVNDKFAIDVNPHVVV